ncbi:unnamed protein product [Lactuca virosa]|uniref:Cullin family profile domain-containing protein n=1 Tax=Lactuca virosa TaxID=75947 RepID=A0AAU9LVT0_9ASTR|nr:unnamed protein product [Lactuca virosa]
MIPMSLGIKPAALASSKELIDLEKRLSENLSTYRDTLFEECLRFLKEVEFGFRESSNRLHSPGNIWTIYVETASVFFKVLQSHTGLLTSNQLIKEMERLYLKSPNNSLIIDLLYQKSRSPIRLRKRNSADTQTIVVDGGSSNEGKLSLQISVPEGYHFSKVLPSLREKHGEFMLRELVVGLQEQVFVRKVIELHDKYMTYVNDCFMNHTLFHKALKEAFEVFCNKGVSGSSSAELLATFCDNILKKGGSEKLSDEAIEDTLEKAFKLLAYIIDKDLFAEFYRKKLARRLLFDKSANGGQFYFKDGGSVFNSLNQVTHASNFIIGLRTTSSHIGDAGPDGATGGRQLAGEIREGGRKQVLSAARSMDAAGDCDEAANSSMFPLRVGTRDFTHGLTKLPLH